MLNQSLEEIYHQMCARRDAVVLHYLNNMTLKAADPIEYEKYRKEVRTINKRLRTIRECIPANPTLTA